MKEQMDRMKKILGLLLVVLAGVILIRQEVIDLGYVGHRIARGAERTSEYFDTRAKHDIKKIAVRFRRGVDRFREDPTVALQLFNEGWKVTEVVDYVSGDTILLRTRDDSKWSPEVTLVQPEDVIDVYTYWDTTKLLVKYAGKEGWLRRISYIKENYMFAINEMLLYGIPASVTLAQAILEGESGQSELASAYNNHFGIKCYYDRSTQKRCEDSSWSPILPAVDCVRYRTREYDGEDYYVSDCDWFCVYPNVESSYRAHSNFLMKERYRNIFNHPVSTEMDLVDGVEAPYYVGVTYELEKAGYATGQNYGLKLAQLIDDLGLSGFDFYAAQIAQY